MPIPAAGVADQQTRPRWHLIECERQGQAPFTVRGSCGKAKHRHIPQARDARPGSVCRWPFDGSISDGKIDYHANLQFGGTDALKGPGEAKWLTSGAEILVAVSGLDTFNPRRALKIQEITNAPDHTDATQESEIKINN